MSEEVFSSDMPELQSLIKKLDVFDEETNKAVRTAMHKGADIIMNEQKKLISGKGKWIADAISKSSIYANKKSEISISIGYHSDAFNYENTENQKYRTHTGRNGIVSDSDYWKKATKEKPGVIGLMYEFGRPGTSTAHHRNKPTMKQVRKRIPNKKTAKRSKWKKAVPTEVEISKGTIQAVPHIRRGFDIKKEEAVNIVLEAVNREIDKL